MVAGSQVGAGAGQGDAAGFHHVGLVGDLEGLVGVLSLLRGFGGDVLSREEDLAPAAGRCPRGGEELRYPHAQISVRQQGRNDRGRSKRS